MSAQARQWTIYYAYTLWSVLGMIVMVPVLLLLAIGEPAADELGDHPLGAVLLLAQIVLSVLATRGALRTWATAAPSPQRGRWDLPQLGVLMGGARWLALAALATLALGGAVLAGPGSLLLLQVSIVLLVVATLFRVPSRWLLLAALLGLLLFALGILSRSTAVLASITLGAVLALRPSIWLGAVVRELDDAREAQARLAVAEERLRFARDLHDVTGRDLSVIAVKSELVAQLAERGDPRAAEHGREAAQIARASLAEIRSLVRGYREADLATELQGTASLLRSAHAEVTIDGTAEDVPVRHRGTAAWVLREGGTNILRHADPSTVAITLAPQGITLVNDGSPGDAEVREGSGLTGMRERLGEDAELTARRDQGRFTLDIRFDTTGDAR